MTPVSLMSPIQGRAAQVAANYSSLDNLTPSFVAGIDVAMLGPSLPLDYMGISHEWPYFTEYLKGIDRYGSWQP
jgi:hypothetical protein